MKERRQIVLTAWILRSVLLLAAVLAIVAAAVLGPDGEQGDLAFKLLLIGVALYVGSRIFDRR